MATPLFGLADLTPNSTSAYAWANFNQRLAESIAWRRVLISTTTTAPPGSPAEGDLYYVPASPTGAWAGQTGNLACWFSGAWHFVPVLTHMQFYVVGASANQRWNGSAWV